MPLLHKQKFIKKPLPNNIDQNQEVFYCKLTQEIFLDYDEYFERTILCNSLVWTCSLSGKTGLTYSEALQSEEKARQSVSTFPRILEKVIVYLATHTKRGNIKDLLDDIFGYIKDRYFIGELVSVIVGQSINSKTEIHKTCRIVDVIPPKKSVKTNEDDNVIEISSTDSEESSSDDSDLDENNENHNGNNYGPNADKYRYIVESTQSGSNSNQFTVQATQICRPKGLLTKDKVQIILKYSCEAINSIWIVKDSIKDKYSLNSMKFEQIFKGEMPKFDVSFGRGKFSKLNQSNINNNSNNNLSKNKSPIKANNSLLNTSNHHHQHQQQSPSVVHKEKKVRGPRGPYKKTLDRAGTSANSSLNQSKSKTTNNRSSLNNSNLASPTKSKNSSKKRRKSLTKSPQQQQQHQQQKSSGKHTTDKHSSKHETHENRVEDEKMAAENARKQRMAQAQKLMNKSVSDMNDDEFDLWREFVSEDKLRELKEIEFEMEKLIKKEEKEKEKERLREEKLKQKEILKELKKPKEDLDCEHLLDIPRPIPVNTKIPNHLFGDALMIIEFLNCFGDLFNLREDFPNGFNLDLIEDALFSKSCNSPLCNLLLFFLDSVFKCDEEEMFEDVNASSDEDMSDYGVDSDDEDLSIDKMYKNPLDENLNREGFTRLAQKYGKIIKSSQGRKVRSIGLDVYTISEMLRLYYLTSGGLHNELKLKYLSQNRGGYTNFDESGIDFSLNERSILHKLETINVYELEPEEKLKILTSLCHQLSSQVKFRDLMEDNFQTICTLKSQLKDLQTEENKRLREEASDRSKKRLEERAKQKTRLEEIKTNVVASSKANGFDTDHSNQEDEYKLKRQADESAKKREEFLKKEKQLLDELNEAQMKLSLCPIGKDRYFRRYWMFKSFSGLFVEDDDEYIEQIIDKFHQHQSSNNLNLNQQSMIKHETNDFSDNSLIADTSSNMSIDTKHNTINNNQLTNDNNHQNTNTTQTNNTSTEKENHPNHNNLSTNLNISSSHQVSSSHNLNSTEIHNQTGVVEFKKGEVKWCFYYKNEDIDKLIQSLNERGIRESELKQNLIDFKQKLIDRINKQPSYKQLLSNDESANSGKLGGKSTSAATVAKTRKQFQLNKNQIAQSTFANELFELDLRDKIIEIEDQIYVGALGSLKVTDRYKWQEAIKKGGYDPQCTQLTWSSDQVTQVQAHLNENSTNEVHISEVISDLSKALLQIEQAVERRFLRTPLGDVQKTPDKRKNRSVGKKQAENDDNDGQSSSDTNKWQILWNWERSLMNCSSLSQLFVHLQTLDESIAWSKSALNARCRLCKRKGDADKMLLCDKCDRGHHMYCLRPRLKVIPEGEWFCPECRPKDVEKTPRKKRETFVEESNDFYSDEGDESTRNSEQKQAMDISEDEINIDDSYDETEAKTRKTRKRKFDKVSNEAPAKQQIKITRSSKLTTASITSNDSNSGIGNSNSKATATTKMSKNKDQINKDESMGEEHNEFDFRSDDEQYDENDESSKGSKRARNGAKSPFEFHFNTSSRNNELTQRLKQTEKLVNELMKHADAWPFLKPVTKREAPDYFQVIKKPMDFSSIKNNINHYKYDDYSNIIDDIRLVFENCRVYNDDDSLIYKTGERLYKYFETRAKQLDLIPSTTTTTTTTLDDSLTSSSSSSKRKFAFNVSK